MKEIVKELETLGYKVYFDENKMNNFISQNQKNENIIFIEEYHRGNYYTEYGIYKEDNLSLYIYNSGNGKPITAEHRDDIRTELESNIIIPIINLYGDRISNITFEVSPSRYNSIETGITLKFTLKKEICL